MLLETDGSGSAEDPFRQIGVGEEGLVDCAQQETDRSIKKKQDQSKWGEKWDYLKSSRFRAPQRNPFRGIGSRFSRAVQVNTNHDQRYQSNTSVKHIND